jgi:predicted nucleic acid-binding protein
LILDTDIIIALLKGQKDANKAMQRLEENGAQIGIAIITAYELVRGAYLSSKPERNLAEVQQLLSNVEILDLTMQACEEASKIYRDLRKAGCLIGEFDVLIAAIARTHADQVMTRDEHFRLIKGITVAKW